MVINGIILVRSESSRLKNKCYFKFGNINIIEHIIKRCKQYNIKPIICTTKRKKDKKLILIAKKNNINFFSGSTKNKILRISECCKFYNIKEFHTIDADDPFFCGDEVKKSMQLLKKGYQIIKPSKSSAAGGASVGFSMKSKVLHHISDEIKKNEDTEMMWNFFEKRSKKVKICTLPKQKYEIKKCRLTLDYLEDYVFLNTIRKILGNNITRKNIFFLLKKQPELSNINFFRNKEWIANQKNEKK